MQKIEISKENAMKAYNEGCSDVKKVLTNLFGKEVFTPANIMDRVKSFEDACGILGLHSYSEIPFEDPQTKDQEAVNAYAKLFIIAKALNEGWVPDWNNSSQTKFYPWFDMRAGSGFSYHGCDGSHTASRVGSRLCYKSRELAEYVGKQFLAIYKEAFTL